MTKVRAAVFASGTGSNFEAIMKQHDTLGCEIILLISDQQDAKVLEKAKKYGVPTFVFDPKSYQSKKDYEQELVEHLNKANITWIFLAGYMRIVGPTLLRAFEGKMVNIHPSLLPAFPGIDAIGQAFDADATTTGVTVHYIDEGIDTGPMIAQESLEIDPNDTKETLQKRIQKIEHELFPKVIRKLMKQ